jgi:hypothetical protein
MLRKLLLGLDLADRLLYKATGAHLDEHAVRCSQKIGQWYRDNPPGLRKAALSLGVPTLMGGGLGTAAVVSGTLGEITIAGAGFGIAGGPAGALLGAVAGLAVGGVIYVASDVWCGGKPPLPLATRPAPPPPGTPGQL